jgi:hypothetical protein
MSDRTAAEKILQIGLPVVVGGVAKSVRPLPMAKSRYWVANSLARHIAELWGGVGDIETWEDAAAKLAGAPDAMLDCIVDYDLEASLGGREWLDENATPAEIYEVFKAVAKSAFPFAPDATKYLPNVVSLVMAEVAKAAAKTPASSTPDDSPAGVVSPRK